MAFMLLYPGWMIAGLLGLLLAAYAVRLRRRKLALVSSLMLMLLFTGIASPDLQAATILNVDNNSLRIGYDIYSLNSSHLSNENIELSAGALNEISFKIGGRWYDVLGAESDADLGNASKALSEDTVMGWTDLNTWYKAGELTETLFPALSSPTGISAATVSSTQIDLGWNAVANATSYNIYRSANQAGPFSLIGTSSTTSFSNNDLAASTTYWYQVAAVNSGGEGSPSATVSATTRMNPPAAPTGLTAATVSSTRIDLSWNATATATSYNIYRSANQAGPFPLIGTSSTTSFINNDLAPATSYWYQVAAINSGGEGPRSATVSATTRMNPPAAPTGLSAATVSSTRIDLNWNAAANATSYNIYRSANQAGPFSLIGTSSTTSFINNDLAPATSYWYQVAAINSGGEGSPSATVSATTSAGIDTYLNQAQVHFDNEAYNDAIAVCNEIINLDSNNVEAYLIRGYSYLWSDQTCWALPDFNTVLQIDPNNGDAHCGRGWYYLEVEVYSTALNEFNNACGLDPNALSLEGRGITYAFLGQPNQALQDFSALIQLEPSVAIGYQLRGTTYFELDDYQESINDCTKAIQLDPNSAVAYNNRGAAHLQLDNYQKALNDFNQALQIDAEFIYAYNNIGVVHYIRDEYQSAISAYSQAIAVDPDYALAYTNRGEAYRYKGYYNYALLDYNRALEIEPQFMHAFSGRGWYYVQKRSFYKAISDFTTWLNINSQIPENDSYNPWRATQYHIAPGEAEVINGRGWSYYHTEQYSNATTDFTNCLAISPNYSNAYLGRGWSYYCRNQYSLAISDFSSCIVLDPSNADAYEGRGWSYYWLDQYYLAINDFTNCIAYNPENDWAYDGRGWSYLALGKYNQAEQNFRQCLTINPGNEDAKEGLRALGYTIYSQQSTSEGNLEPMMVDYTIEAGGPEPGRGIPLLDPLRCKVCK